MGTPTMRYSPLLPTGPDTTGYRLLTTDGVELLDGPRGLRFLSVDPAASPNDRFVALDLLRNANIAAGGVLPMCQDTGTVIVMGKRGRHVLTDGADDAAIAQGVYQAYTRLNLRYSQLAPLTMWEERNTGST